MRELLSYSFVIPPMLFIVSCLAGAVLTLGYPLIGTKIVLVSSSALYLFATPVASTLLTQQLVALIPENVDLAKAQAIVVPGADGRVTGDGQGSPSIGPMTLDRLASAARLHARLHLPVVVSGGRFSDSAVSLADLMRNEMEKVFSIPVKLVENRSKNTFENASFTGRLLHAEQINTVIVVVQARDMSRALWSFDRASLHALPYCSDSCQRRVVKFSEVTDFLPSSNALSDSYYAFHEIIGLIYYKLAY